MHEDNRATFRISAALFTGFGLLLALIWYAHRGELRHASVTKQFALASQASSDIAIAVQRVTLLQYGLVSNRTGELTARIEEEVRRELHSLTELEESVADTSTLGALSPSSVSSAELLRSQVQDFAVTGEELLQSLARREVPKPLIESFASLSGEIVATSRAFRRSVVDDSVAGAVAEERSRSTVFAATMIYTVCVGIVVLLFVTTRLRRDFALRRSAEQRLISANRDLEHFAGTVAHDLNSPLSNISLAAHAIERTTAGATPALLELTGMLKREAKRLHSMVDALLRLAKISSTRVRADTISMTLLLEQVTDGLKSKLEGANAVVSHSGEDLFWGDSALMNNLLQNLIENSIKYSRPGHPPVVSVSLSHEEGFLVLRYEDNGQGIPAQSRPHIFDPFYQCNQIEGEGMGLGLGLSVVHRIVVAHSGSISVEEKATEGALFFMRFPLRERLDPKATNRLSPLSASPAELRRVAEKAVIQLN